MAAHRAPISLSRSALRLSGIQRTIIRMARLPGGFPRRPDPQVMFAVHYEDGRTVYIRVGRETARHGTMIVMDVARERQAAGEIPGGTIVSVKQVR